MRYPILGLLLALGLLCATPTSTAIQPPYGQHVGSDEASFSAIRQSVTDEENRRRADDQHIREHLTQIDMTLGGLIKQADFTEKRVDKWEDRMFWLAGSIFLLIVGQCVNLLFSIRTHNRVNGYEYDTWDRKTERRKGVGG